MCTGGHWDEGATATDGDWFTGTHCVDDREWQTRSQVVAADRGREFAFVVGGAVGGWVRWGYLLSACGGGTDATETWQVLRIVPHMGETDEQLAALRERTAGDLRETLDAVQDMLTDMAGSSSPESESEAHRRHPPDDDDFPAQVPSRVLSSSPEGTVQLMAMPSSHGPDSLVR